MKPEPTIAQIDAARVWLLASGFDEPLNPLNLGLAARAVAIDRIEREAAAQASQEPIPMRLHCPMCHELHIDEGAQATIVHRTHACQECGCLWAPAVVPTVGVRFLPGCKNDRGQSNT